LFQLNYESWHNPRITIKYGSDKPYDSILDALIKAKLDLKNYEDLLTEISESRFWQISLDN